MATKATLKYPFAVVRDSSRGPYNVATAATLEDARKYGRAHATTYAHHVPVLWIMERTGPRAWDTKRHEVAA